MWTSMVDMSTNFCGITLKNPVMTASGTCGFGMNYFEYYKPNSLGAIVVKGTTLAPQDGNPTPRIAETPSGIINAIGLQNPGIDAFLSTELPNLRKYDGTVVIANIAGKTIEDYCEIAHRISDSSVDMVELNISCPNVKEGGVAFGTDERVIEEITRRVKVSCTKPLIVKLSPNVTSIKKMAKAAENGGADAVSLINTLLGMSIDIKTRRPIIKNNVGGLSGPAVKPVALRMVYEVRSEISLPIIGMGGIATASDAIEFMLAGACAVAVGTAVFKNPHAPMEIVTGIEKYLSDNGHGSPSEIVGKLKTW